jgi:DNA polymerase-4
MIHDMNSYDLQRNVHRITLYNTVAADQQHVSRRKRLYVHLDMNCFYAQVEQQSYDLHGMPLVIGGWRRPNGIARGICATSSYEARELGIKTAMSAYEAQQICPQVLFLQVHYEKYQAISREISEILHNFSPDIESYSMDEYFLDITFAVNRTPAEIEDIGRRLKNALYRETQLIASVGISYSKTYAKLASDLHKPDGLTLILTEEDAARHIYNLDLDEVWGIGRRRYEKLQQRGLHTIQDAIDRGVGAFQDLFGDYFGKMLFETVSGQDHAKVLDNTNHVPKEVSYMHTFSDWTEDPERVRGEITKAVWQLCYRMRGYDRKARMYSCHIRFQDVTWKGVSVTFSTEGFTNLDEYVLQACLAKAMPLVKRYLREGHTIRGVGLHTIELTETKQLELFFSEDEKLSRLHYATDKINNHYGLDTILPTSLKYDVPGKTHFLNRSAG